MKTPKKIRHGLSKLPPLLDTKISGHVSKQGKLNLRGYALIDLAKNVSFEEVAYLLIYEKLPCVSELNNFQIQLKQEKSPLPIIAQKLFSNFSGKENTLSMLSSCISGIASLEKNTLKKNKIELQGKAIQILSFYSTLLSAYVAKRRQYSFKDINNLSGNLSQNFLTRCFGEQNVKDKAYYLDQLLVLASEQVIAASSFVARNSASTRTNFFSSVVASINTWNGFRHGAASEFAFNDLKQIKDNNLNISEFYQEKRKQNLPIFGFGHRRYKDNADPRSLYLHSLTKEMSEKYDSELYSVTQSIIEYFTIEENKYPNPELYVALVCDCLGFVADEIPAVVFMGRLTGVCAHIIEENGPMRPLLRGEALYTGKPISEITPIDRR